MHGTTIVPTSDDTPELLGQRGAPHCIPIRTFINPFITAVTADRPTLHHVHRGLNACILVSCADNAFLRGLRERCVSLLAV